MSAFLSKLSVIKPALGHLSLKIYSNAATRNLGTKVNVAAKNLEAPKNPSNSEPSAATSTKCSKSSGKPQHICSNFIVDKCDVFDVPRPNIRPYRLISYCMIPLIVALAYNVFFSSSEEKEPPPYVPYEHMFRHTKRFPWGDGRLSFFHGPFNLIPDEETYDRENLSNVDEEDLNRRKAVRDQHAKEELDKRQRRHERGG